MALGLVASIVVATTPTAAQPAVRAVPMCKGKVATIVGTKRGDELKGTKRGDVIVARGGDDVIDGRGGNDLICAGRGNDFVAGGAGKDRIYGENGGDISAHGKNPRGYPSADTATVRAR